MVRLSDVFTPQVYGSYTSLNTTETNAFVKAGIIAVDPIISGIAAQGGKTGTIPFWKDIDQSIEPNYSNDDPTDRAVPNKVGTGTMTYRKAWVNQSFASMNLVVELSKADPLEHIKRRFDNYWVGQQQRRLIATLKGIIADNVANDGSDMVIDVSTRDTATNPDAQYLTGDVFIDAAYTMGDQVENLKGIAVHSMIAATWDKANELETIRDSDGNILLKSYKGRVVIVDDMLPVTGTGADRVYTSVLFGVGAFGFGGVEGHAFALGEGVPARATWTEFDEQSGNGGGSETIGERKTWIIHPFGFTWNENASPALVEMSPTLAELAQAPRWDRVVARKNVPLAFVKSKAKPAAA